jgi:hypothetical protein
MATNQVDLSAYTNVGFERGAGAVKEGLWMLVSLLLFRLCPLPLYGLKKSILRWFGAQVGEGVVIKPDVRITFPWKLILGEHVWLGEGCWLLKLAPITVESNACISQRGILDGWAVWYYALQRVLAEILLSIRLIEDGHFNPAIKERIRSKRNEEEAIRVHPWH